MYEYKWAIGELLYACLLDVGAQVNIQSAITNNIISSKSIIISIYIDIYI